MPYENNIVSDYSDYNIHPFVSGGNICWGNATATMGKLKGQFELAKMLQLLSVLLTMFDVNANPFAYPDNFRNRHLERPEEYGNAKYRHPKFKPLDNIKHY